MHRETGPALIAGNPALDLANTVGWHAGEHQDESLHHYDDLLAWSVHAGVVSRGHATQLGRKARAQPAAARRALTQAIALRELIYRIFAQVAHGAPPAAADLDALRQAQIAALRHGRADWSDGLVVSFSRSTALLAPVYPLALEAVALLRSPDCVRVRQCANDPCGWLFVDRSKNHSRRWCSSEDCGNETRVRRFRERNR